MKNPEPCISKKVCNNCRYKHLALKKPHVH
jgi:hypothetical protein